MRTVVLSEHDLPTWSASYRRGEAPSLLPYGVEALERSGFRLVGSQRSKHPLVSRARQIVEHRTHMQVERSVRAAFTVRRSDLVLALLENQALLTGLLKQLRVPPYASTPLVIWSCWLADDLRRADAGQRQWLLKRVGAADLITHLSRHETQIFTDMGIPEEKLFAVTYGVSHEFYRPGNTPRDIPILAVGQDRGRDYKTLFDAVRGTTLAVDLVCKPENLAGLDVPPNIRFHGTVPLAQYRQLLQRAQVVAVPTHDMAYPTGSSVALEAAASGCTVVVTGTRAMRDYFEHDVNAHFVGEGDVEGWRHALANLTVDVDRRSRLGAAARENVTSRFNADHMWTELANELAKRGILPR